MNKSVAVLGDLHFGVRSASTYYLDNQRKFFDEVFFPYLLKNDIKTVLQLGDTFDTRKFINVNVLANANDFYFDKFSEYGIELITILGNHCVLHKNSNHISSMIEICKNKENITLIQEFESLVIMGIRIDFMPWINAENYDASIDMVKNSLSDLLIGHFEINGFEMVSGIECYEGLSQSMFEHYDLVLSGHFHKRAILGNINYVGTPYQMDWNDFGQVKGFHILNLDTLTTEFYFNPDIMYHKIVYDDTTEDFDKFDIKPLRNSIVRVIVDKKENDEMFDRFIYAIQNIVHDLQISDFDAYDFNLDEEQIGDVDVEDSYSILIKSVDFIKTSIDKNNIKTKLSELHNESRELLN